MRCPKDYEIVAYADGEMQNTARRKRIEKHLHSCEECQEWLRTYSVLQKVGEKINPNSVEVPEFKMSHSCCIISIKNINR